MRKGYFLLPALLLLNACTVYKNTPKTADFETRYKLVKETKTDQDDANAPLTVNMYANISPAAGGGESPKTALNFQGEGQKALINAYAKMSKTPEQLQEALNASYFKAAADNSTLDYTETNVTATISISPKALANLQLSPGDRLEDVQLKFVLNAGQPGAYLKSWDRFKTQYGRFYIGSRSFTGNQEVNINPSVTLASAAAFSLGNYDSKSQYVIQDTVSQQVVVANGILDPQYFSISETGTPKTSLLGNTIVNLTVASNQPKPGLISSFDGLIVKDALAAPKDVKLNVREFLLPNFRKDLKGKLIVTYSFRHIADGERTYSEEDDDVIYYKGKVTSDDITLIAQRDLHPTIYELLDDVGHRVLQLQDLRGIKKRPFDLYLASQEEADELLTWLAATLPKCPGGIIFNGRYQLVILHPNRIEVIKPGFDLSSFVPKDID